jgi:plastocyanin
MIEELWSSLIAFTSQFVVPDWGSLIALLPIFLAIPVVLYITWIVYRFATAGPTRRGKRRLPPAPPEGVHMPGPSFAPVLAAVGAVSLVFGLVVGGIWLVVGLVILVITLLYWGREALRDYDHMPAGGGQAVAVGMLPAPVGTPPDGVHMPPPSFRPVLVAIAMTMVVTGLIIGGWALLVGFIAIAIVGLGWLWDARREYREVETADITGHRETGGAPSWPKATFAGLAILVAFATLFSSGIVGNSGGGATGAPASAAPAGQAPAPGESGAPPSSGASGGPSLPAADASVTASGIAWVETSLTVPAGKPFTLAFDNQDAGTPHDVVIKDAGGQALFQGDVVTGPKVVVYDVPAIPKGSYTFVCSIHPNMTGSVTSQ